jgi:hypothetical protein
MARIELNGDRLTVHVRGLERLLALRRRLEIDYDHIVSVEVHGIEQTLRERRGWELRVPAVVAPTTFYQRRERRAQDTSAKRPVLVIGVYGERYRRLVLEVEDGGESAAALRAAVRRDGTDHAGRSLHSGRIDASPKTRVETPSRLRSRGPARVPAG